MSGPITITPDQGRCRRRGARGTSDASPREVTVELARVTRVERLNASPTGVVTLLGAQVSGPLGLIMGIGMSYMLMAML